jgi:hypothetical protein
MVEVVLTSHSTAVDVVVTAGAEVLVGDRPEVVVVAPATVVLVEEGVVVRVV